MTSQVQETKKKVGRGGVTAHTVEGPCCRCRWPGGKRAGRRARDSVGGPGMAGRPSAVRTRSASLPRAAVCVWPRRARLRACVFFKASRGRCLTGGPGRQLAGSGEKGEGEPDGGSGAAVSAWRREAATCTAKVRLSTPPSAPGVRAAAEPQSLQLRVIVNQVIVAIRLAEGDRLLSATAGAQERRSGHSDWPARAILPSLPRACRSSLARAPPDHVLPMLVLVTAAWRSGSTCCRDVSRM